MRSKERIARIVLKLQTLWLQYPDLRFWQLLQMFNPEGKDLFYFEDDEFEKVVDKQLQNLSARKYL
jgi:hypothetical protein